VASIEAAAVLRSAAFSCCNRKCLGIRFVRRLAACAGGGRGL